MARGTLDRGLARHFARRPSQGRILDAIRDRIAALEASAAATKETCDALPTKDPLQELMEEQEIVRLE